MSAAVIGWGLGIGFTLGNFAASCIGYGVTAARYGVNDDRALRGQLLVVFTGLAFGFMAGMAAWSLTS